MQAIDDLTKENIAKAIKQAELNSSCEIVAVSTQKSDTYLYIPLMVSAILALVLPYFYMVYSGIDDMLHLYKLQIIIFSGLVYITRISFIQRFFIPSSVFHKRSSLKARESFVTLGLHKTHNRQAVMVFVSLYERYVEIVCDVGVKERIDEHVWKEIVATFIEDIREGDFSKGYEKAITSCALVIEKEFPKQEEEEDELPNYLIEI